jgi:hypothetical protein
MTTDWRKLEDERAAVARLTETKAVPAWRPGRPLGLAVSRTLAPILKQAGPARDTLASRWADIVGERLAAVSSPVRVSKGKTGGVLHLRAPSAAAPMIQHAAEHILERVNLASGSKIRSIRIVHTAAPAQVQTRRARPLTPAEREALFRRLAPVRTPAVRDALAELGEAILGSGKPDAGVR